MRPNASGTGPSRLALVALLLGATLLGCGERRGVPDADDDYVRQIREWHRRRIERLRRPDGWLSLVGLYWLHEGPNRFGSDPANDLVFPEKAPRFIGTFYLRGSTVTVRIRPGVEVLVDGAPVDTLELRSDAAGEPTVFRWGSLAWYVIERGGRYAVRLKDSDSPVRRQFRGIEMFPVDPRWRVRARFVPYRPARTVRVPTVLGTTAEMSCPGALVFELDGKTYRLDAFAEEGDETLFVIFGDRTNGAETYGAGRFLTAPRPGPDGFTWIDFNKAYNPPCAFTPYATCPLPPEQNVLPICVKAGEKKVAGGH